MGAPESGPSRRQLPAFAQLLASKAASEILPPDPSAVSAANLEMTP